LRRKKKSYLGVRKLLRRKTPNLPESVYNNVPDILKESLALFGDNTEKDIFLIGAIGLLSACLPNVRGIYFNKPYSPHLFVFITAPAGSGKSNMEWSKFFGQVIHYNIIATSKRAKEDYETELEQFNSRTRKEKAELQKPEEPPYRMFFIPANCSASAFVQALHDNNFQGVIFETEADTLANSFKQEWGNFSDVLRKAFHHESTNMKRRSENEYIEIKDPHLAIVLSGTPKQVHNLMPDVENGLFSRFLYYAFEDESDFKNPFVSHSKVNYVDFFNEKGQQIFELYNSLNNLQLPISFEFSKAQQDEFTHIFNDILKRNKLLLGNDFTANIKRLGVITFRIAMILSTLRILEDGVFSSPMICSDIDFNTSLEIAITLEKHAVAVFQNLPKNELKDKKLKFFEALPQQFDRQTYLEIAAKFQIINKTAEKYIGQFRKAGLLKHEHNLYSKIQS